VAKYTLVRALSLCLAVVVGVFLAIILINFGGFVDQIYQERINWVLTHMAMDMHGMSANVTPRTCRCEPEVRLNRWFALMPESRHALNGAHR